MTSAVPTGYDPDFLGVALPLPAPVGEVRELPYTHFSVLLDPRRRLAVVTGVNIAGAELVDVGRDDDWQLDPRVPAAEQAGPQVYTGNDLDRGHLVRRLDPVWGDPQIAAQANLDTFGYPNAAPQAAGFNQSKDLWLGLEDHVLAYADVNDLRLSVWTAPVLATDDPVYRGIGIPRLFWKVAAWSAAGTLATAAFVLDQTPQLGDLEPRQADDPPPLGPFRTFQVPVSEVAALTGLDLGPAVAADRLPVAAAEARRIPLDGPASIRL